MAQEVIPAGSFYPAQPVRPDNGDGVGWDTTQQLLFVIFKWKRFIVSVFLIFTLAALVAVYLKPPVRSAVAEILIKVDRVPLQISGFGYRPEKNQIGFIMNSEAELIRSRHVLSAVAKKLHPKRNMSENEIDLLVDALAASTFPVALPESNVLQITYFADTSQRAEKVLRLIIDEYIEKQAAIQSGSDKLLNFYEHESQRVEEQLKTAEAELNEWQSKNDTVSITQQITNQLNILDDRTKVLRQAEAQQEATRGKIAVLQNELKALPERMLAGQDQMLNPVAMKLKEQLAAAELALQDLLQRFTEGHRTVTEKREQIAFIKKELAAAEEKIVGRETISLNPLRQHLTQQLAEAQAHLATLTAERQTVAKQVEEVSATLPGMREKKVKIDELSRIVDLRKDAFMLYGKKLEEGRVATGLGKEQLANLALIGPPHARQASDLQKRVLMVCFSAFVGLGLGMAIAFGIEFFNTTLRTRQDVEYYLGLPVLAAIPDLQPRPLLNP